MVVAIVVTAGRTRRSMFRGRIIAPRLVPTWVIAIGNSSIAGSIRVFRAGVLVALLGTSVIVSGLGLPAAIVVGVPATMRHSPAESVFL